MSTKAKLLLANAFTPSRNFVKVIAKILFSDMYLNITVKTLFFFHFLYVNPCYKINYCVFLNNLAQWTKRVG